ncbi:uncharacterized protein LOC123605416 isoform X2 [Leopardus geoffroyi]|uniref:uncharacterized protein LOC123605416 isoform X2 n=1 Tax=Leopardus geoffroyi TaxID=46844 RepID=UPI001E261EFC|nr:uncharacterized protein LOC123605416 isoform X2 [Leopardus geoffroyi]
MKKESTRLLLPEAPPAPRAAAPATSAPGVRKRKCAAEADCGGCAGPRGAPRWECLRLVCRLGLSTQIPSVSSRAGYFGGKFIPGFAHGAEGGRADSEGGCAGACTESP